MAQVVVYDEVGGPDVLHLIDQPTPEPAPGQVRVRIEAFAINPLDLMMRAGTAPVGVPLPGARLGIEGTGVIDAVGDGVADLQPGTAVIITALPDASVNGSYAEYVVLPASRVIPRPAGLDVVEAAAIWVGFSTAYGALSEKAQMRSGDRVLINAASGSVGRAAIAVARQIGAVPIALTRYRSTIDTLLAAGAAAVIATEADDLVEAVLRHTGGTGADIVLDLVTGPGQHELARVAKEGATLIAAGFLDPRPSEGLPLGREFEFYRGFDYLLDEEVVRRMAAFLDAGLRLGALRPTLGEVFSLDRIAEAHRLVEEGRHRGKVVVDLRG